MPSLRYDLHCHSLHSDGLLSPTAVVERAASRGVDVLALTDHDELAGLDEATEAAARTGIRLVLGSELSVSWRDLTIHVVALNIDPADPALRAGLSAIREGRVTRARRMGASLEEAGVEAAYEGALAHASSERLLSRSHFARYLVGQGHARDVHDVFKRFLVSGKPGYVAHEWASLGDAVSWIHGAGGQAVIAHPGRYKVTAGEQRSLFGEFRELGGDAIEVMSSSHTAAQCAEYARHARIFGFLGSTGSDYHGPGESWVDLGGMEPPPAGVTPVWADW